MYNLFEILTTVALAMLIYMTSWFVLAVILKRRDVVDSAWGLGFIVVASIAYLLRNNDSGISLVTLLLVAVWGARLFAHLTLRNRKKSEDYRYKNMGALTSPKIWMKTFFSVFLLQGVLLIIISLPVVAVMSADHITWSNVAVVGVLVWIFGIGFEAAADYQLQRFLQTKQKGIMQSGLWKYSRHPNYFGEITVWWGAAVVAAACQQWWGIIGAVVISYLIIKVSGIPLLEKRYAENPAYQKYAKQTSILIPLPRKRSAK